MRRNSAPQPGKLPFENLPKPESRQIIDLDPSKTVSANLESVPVDGGLSIEDGESRYLVVDLPVVSTFHQPVITEKVGLPRPHRPKGKLTFSRPEKTDSFVKTSLFPRRVMRGKVVSFERPEEQLPKTVTETPSVVVVEYNARTGEALYVSERPKADFNRTIDKLGQGSAHNVRVGRSPKPDAGERINFNLAPSNKGSKVNQGFSEIEDKLKKEGIANWEGMVWRQGGIDHEVVWDGAIKRPAVIGGGHDHIRTFAIKRSKNGLTLPSKISTIYHLAGTFSGASNIHIYRPNLPAQPSEAQRYNNARLNSLKKELGREAVRSLNFIDARHVTGLAGRTAVWALTHPEFLNEDRRKAMASKILRSEIGKKQVESIRDTIESRGLLTLFDTALAIRREFLESLVKLDSNITGAEQSLTTVMEAMTASGKPASELLGTDKKAEIARQALVDELVGRAVARPVSREEAGDEAYGKTLIQRGRQVGQPNDVDASGQLIHRTIDTLAFNERFFTRTDPPFISNDEISFWKVLQAFRMPAMDAAEDILDDFKRKKQPDPESYRRLGYHLRVMVGANRIA